MPLHKPTLAAEFDGNLSSDLVGELVALKRLGDEERMDTKNGQSPYVRVHALIVTEDGGLRNLGELPIFWTAVRGAVLRVPDGEWIAGSVEKADGKTYYVITAPEDPSDWTDLEAIITRAESDPDSLPPVETPDDAVTDGAPL